MKKTTRLSITGLVAGLLCLHQAHTASGQDLTWQTVNIPGLPEGTTFWSLTATAPDNVFVWGRRVLADQGNLVQASLYHFNGVEWSVSFQQTGVEPGYVFSPGAAEVYASCGNLMWRSGDNGLTWQLQALPGTPIGKITGTPGNIHVRCSNGRIVRWDGTSWAIVYNNSQDAYAMTLVSPTEGYFATCFGWGTWDGSAWQFVSQGWDFCDIYDTWAVRDADGLHWWAVGNNNFANGIRIWCWNPATQSFGSKHGGCFSEGINSYLGSAYWIAGSSAVDVYVYGELAAAPHGSRSGRLYHWSGTNWTRLFANENLPGSGGLAVLPDGEVWLAQLNGTLRLGFRELVSGSADLALTQSGPASAGLWGALSYTLTVSNAGPDQATGVVLADTLPTFALITSVTPSQGTSTVSSNSFSCAVGTLEAGATATVQVLARGRCTGSGFNFATVTASSTDPVMANNRVSRDVVVNGAEVNIARNPSGTGFPSPLESDPGWAGGSYPWEIVDGLQTYSDWPHGLAFTGGLWGPGQAGPRQATISLGSLQTFYKVIIWHHGHDGIPEVASLDYWNGTAWVAIAAQRRIAAREAGGAGSTSDEYVFAPVTGSKVRWSMDNRLNNILGVQNTHGWIYEFEVFAASQCDQAVLAPKRLVALDIFGVPGRTYRVEYTPALADPPNWQTLTTVTITTLPTVVVDYESATEPSRFYRTVEQ